MIKIGCIEEVKKNVGNISASQFKPFYKSLEEADCFIVVSEGRSQSALYAGMWQTEEGIKVVKTMSDIDFPGSNIKKAAPILEKGYNKIVLLVNSGSGETSTPKIVVKQLSDYIETTGSKQFTINAVVSDIHSSIGKIGKKEYGNVVKLEGRKTEKNSGDDFLKGMMNDVYELGSLLTFQKTKEGLNKRSSYEFVLEEINSESGKISEIIDKFVSWEFFSKIISRMETRGRITMGGSGPARNVARMTAIRLQHLKRAIGDEAYLSGPFAPRPRAGDILFLISQTGETEQVLNWCREQKKFAGYVYSIVGSESTLSRESASFIIESADDPIFYERAAFALSILPLYLAKRLYDRGFRLPEYIIEWFQHSITE